eukprot:3999233-Pleurochrysis_carterae.AAC.1
MVSHGGSARRVADGHRAVSGLAVRRFGLGGSPPPMASSAALADASNLTKQFDAVLSRVLLKPKMGEPPRQPEDY